MADILNSVALSDGAMAQEFQNATGEMLVVVNGFTAATAQRHRPLDPWVPVARGDFGEEASRAAKTLASAGRLQWQQVTHSPAATDWGTVTPVSGTLAILNTWISNAKTLTSASGRGHSLTKPQENAFGLEAKWRCQFSGCGKDLMKHRATGATSKSSYFAHIIASSPDGPRGSTTLSHALSADVNNYLLLCDECHRRIDREDPDRFTVDVLRKMRRDSLVEVERLLDSLQHKEAIPVAIVGNITGQSAHLDWRDVEEGLWSRKLRKTPGHPYTFLENGWSTHDPHSQSYWSLLLQGMGAELAQMRKLLAPNPGAPGGGKHFAILPLHSTSVLVLAGRIFGEAASATVLQFRRQLTQGKWSVDAGAPSVALPTFKLVRHREHSPGETEACLLVSLTFSITPERLEPHIHDGGFKMPTIEITSDAPLSPSILDRPESLEALSLTMSDAVQVLQEDWKVKQVHLVIGSPASGVFKFGQKLQARNQASYICYESAMGATPGVFKSTIEITGSGVRALGSSSWTGLI
ncbi:hypothetical protein RP29_18725 [Acidovorax temperans]|uniref:SMODS-associated and fused to various effectors domain-containing protein n=1 Tax=Acidovorax temperans TaxID=80878 RepID=A0A0D7K4W1_9BURK|nr:SAVED domain-containing protein [Acidovorax temperans]KJA09017.1 hypothetical protein RP29_18725 [Acidovorax temperans]